MDPFFLLIAGILGRAVLEQYSGTPPLPGQMHAPGLYAAICEEFRTTADPGQAQDRARRTLAMDPTFYDRQRASRGLHPQVAPVPEISATELRAELPTVQVLDVRASPETAGPLTPIRGSVHIPVHRLELEVPRSALDPHKPTVVLCKKGLRSGCAIERLHRLGFTDIRSLQGGLQAWHGQ